MARSSVRDTDKGYAALLKRIEAKALTLTVGIQDEEAGAPAGDGSITIGELATIHEYGLGVPQRSFIRSWFDENKAANKALIRNLAVGVVKGKVPSAEAALEQAGLAFVGGIQSKISEGIPPPNAPSTIAAKGSSIPLIKTGQLRASVRHKVTK